MSDLPTIGSTALLAEHRKRANGPAIRAAIGGKLNRLASLIARDDINVDGEDACPATAAFVVIITEGQPILTWAGEVSWDDLATARNVLSDANLARYSYAGEEQSIGDRVREGWLQRRRHSAMQAQRMAEAANAKPWQCEHCDKRYATERGAKQHERGCYRNPGARQYQPGGGYVMNTRDDGTFAGFQMIPVDGKDPVPDP